MFFFRGRKVRSVNKSVWVSESLWRARYCPRCGARHSSVEQVMDDVAGVKCVVFQCKCNALVLCNDFGGRFVLYTMLEYAHEPRTASGRVEKENPA